MSLAKQVVSLATPDPRQWVVLLAKQGKGELLASLAMRGAKQWVRRSRSKERELFASLDLWLFARELPRQSSKLSFHT